LHSIFALGHENGLSAEDGSVTIVIGLTDADLGSETMQVRSRFDAMTKTLTVFAASLCLVGAAAAMYVVLVRIPALAGTKLDLLLGTLQGVAVGLLFAIAALLICLTYTIRRANRPPVGDGSNPVRAPGPNA
jgi:hypothetical protein